MRDASPCLISYVENAYNALTSDSDMANISVGWEVDGILTPELSVSAMLKVIPAKTIKQSGTFWTWEGKVRNAKFLLKFG